MNRASVAVLIVTCASAWYLTGLIWTIQWVHYPLFEMVNPDVFVRYEAAHTIAITTIVGPVMLAELVSAVAWIVVCPASLGRATPVTGLCLVILVWVSTAVLQVPLHDMLSNGYDAQVISTLVATNWIRTTLWTTRSGMLAWTLWQFLSGEPAGSSSG
ncbi:MAG: hypothetical protein EXR45_02810 [Chloroflexi bacterium]|nr:hypothetical protein [Chloroflexota bacterium]